MLDRCEERQERNHILIVCFFLNFNGFSGGTRCHNSWELSAAMISADALKVFHAFLCGGGVWTWDRELGVVGKLQNDGA